MNALAVWTLPKVLVLNDTSAADGHVPLAMALLLLAFIEVSIVSSTY